MTLDLHDADPRDSDARSLLNEAALAAGAPVSEGHAAPALLGGTILLARVDGVAAGCAVLQTHPPGPGDGAAEVARLFVRAGQRRRGVGKGLLDGLERRARDAGASRLRLALRLPPGEALDVALRFCAAQGYARIPPFGPHRDDPAAVCHEKRLLDAEPVFRRALAQDLEAIVALLADDALGATRERFALPLPRPYALAFEEIDADPQQELIVACSGDAVVGVLQLTVIPGLTHLATRRALIEGVRVARDQRSRGLGRQLFEHAIARARERGCGMVQLTTDKARPDALRFYQALGFVASHEGMKLQLRTPA